MRYKAMFWLIVCWLGVTPVASTSIIYKSFSFLYGEYIQRPLFQSKNSGCCL